MQDKEVATAFLYRVTVAVSEPPGAYSLTARSVAKLPATGIGVEIREADSV